MSLGTRYNINYWHVLPIPFIKPISGTWPAPAPEPRGAITILPVGFGRHYHLHSQNSLPAAEGLTVCVVFEMWLFGVWPVSWGLAVGVSQARHIPSVRRAQVSTTLLQMDTAWIWDMGFEACWVGWHQWGYWSFTVNPALSRQLKPTTYFISFMFTRNWWDHKKENETLAKQRKSYAKLQSSQHLSLKSGAEL